MNSENTERTELTEVKDESYEALYEHLRQYGQEHVLRFWHELDETGRQKLKSQIQNIDWSNLSESIQKYVLQTPDIEFTEDPKPADYWPVEPQNPAQRQQYDMAVEKGRSVLSEGRVAGFTVAGGQGTRLGFDGPKGTFPISPVKGKTLFQLFAEMILRAQEKYGTTIPWYIMSSPMNHQDILDFFEKHDHFGLDPDNLIIFPQGTMPAIDFNGKVLLENKDSFALAPDGHGGCLDALRNSGALEDMRKRGIDHLSYWQVDNPLIKPFDPLFLGLHEETCSDMSSRALIKRDPYEKLGNFCMVGNELRIVEYSDLSAEKAEQRDEGGNLRYRAGSPAIHLFRRHFIEQVTENRELTLPFHRAEKKVKHVNENGEPVNPETPNAVKLEKFVFDALPLAHNPLILEVHRYEQFAPVKNKTGFDSIDSARHLMMERAARWLERAGVPIPRKENGELDCRLEISPRNYLDIEDLVSDKENLKAPQPQDEVYY